MPEPGLCVVILCAIRGADSDSSPGEAGSWACPLARLCGLSWLTNLCGVSRSQKSF